MTEVQNLLQSSYLYADFSYNFNQAAVNDSYLYVLQISNYSQIEAAEIIKINFYWAFIYRILSFTWGSFSIVFSAIGFVGLQLEAYVFLKNSKHFESPSYLYHKALVGNTFKQARYLVLQSQY